MPVTKHDYELPARILQTTTRDHALLKDKLPLILDPKDLCDALKSMAVPVYDKLVEKVNDKYLKEKDIYGANAALLEWLPKVHQHVPEDRKEEWFYDFLEACMASPRNRVVPKFLEPNYKELLEDHVAKKAARAKPKNVQCNLNIVDGPAPTTPRPQSDYATYRETNIHIEPPSPISLYADQHELAHEAKQGKNTIICAPTGSGKTVVAVDIILDHMKKLKDQGKTARAAMIVPTIPLVEQQVLRILEYMRLDYWINGISGAENLENQRAPNVLASDVIVMTPQILVNMLNSVLEEERLYITDFTLIILDECHHCDSDHPYKVLLDMVREQSIRPQIVGLTASLGTKKRARDIDSNVKHLLKMCSNMLAVTISSVRKPENKQILRERVVPPADAVRTVSRVEDRFRQEVRQEMIRVQATVTDVLKKLSPQEKRLMELKEQDMKFPDPDDINYQSVTALLLNATKRLPPGTSRTFLRCAFEFLSAYFHGLLINDQLPSRYALAYVFKRVEELVQKMDDPREKEFAERFKALYKQIQNSCAQDVDKEILEALYEELRKQFVERPESRVLIFVATRAAAQNLAEHLGEISESKHLGFTKYEVGFMTSTNQSQSLGGQSAEMQREMLTRFENGTIKILVVTSVAEEGLDIAECNLIVKYNSVGSERSLIQRRGRARKMGSKSILLALSAAVESKEFENIQKEHLMNLCISHLQSHSESQLKQKIDQRTDELALEAQREAQMLERRLDGLKGRSYDLKCQNCNDLICQSRYVRNFSNYFVCVDPAIWSRCRIEKDKPSHDGVTTVCAKIVCPKCGCRTPKDAWGAVIKYSGVFLPRLSHLVSIERTDKAEEVQTAARKDWKAISEQLFIIKPIGEEDLTSMVRYMDPKDREEMEAQVRYANELAKEKNWKTKPRKERLLLHD
jgi:ATP-dependent RNA helicase DDX58